MARRRPKIDDSRPINLGRSAAPCEGSHVGYHLASVAGTLGSFLDLQTSGRCGSRPYRAQNPQSPGIPGRQGETRGPRENPRPAGVARVSPYSGPGFYPISTDVNWQIYRWARLAKPWTCIWFIEVLVFLRPPGLNLRFWTSKWAWTETNPRSWAARHPIFVGWFGDRSRPVEAPVLGPIEAGGPPRQVFDGSAGR